MTELSHEQKDRLIIEAVAQIKELGINELMAMHVASGITILMTCGYDVPSAYKNAKEASSTLRPYIASKLLEHRLDADVVGPRNS